MLKYFFNTHSQIWRNQFRHRGSGPIGFRSGPLEPKNADPDLVFFARSGTEARSVSSAQKRRGRERARERRIWFVVLAMDLIVRGSSSSSRWRWERRGCGTKTRGMIFYVALWLGFKGFWALSLLLCSSLFLWFVQIF